MEARKISRWSNTQATREVSCSRCHTAPGIPCKMPSGKETRMPHTERHSAYLAFIGREEFDRRHMGFAGKVWDSDIE